MSFTRGMQLADPFDRRAAEIQRRKPAVPVAEQDPPQGWWTGSGNLGVLVPFTPSANNRQTIIRLPEHGPPRVWSISLGLVNTLTAYNGFNVQAVLSYGAGGATQVLTIDWLNGTLLSLPMNALDVTAAFNGVDVVTEGPGLKLSVLLSRYPLPGGAPPVLTLAEDTQFSPGPAAVFALPPFARRVFLRSTVDPANPAFGPFYSATTILAMQPGDAVGPVFTSMLPFDNVAVAAAGLPVTGSSRRVLVINNGAQPIRGTIYVEF